MIGGAGARASITAALAGALAGCAVAPRVPPAPPPAPAEAEPPAAPTPPPSAEAVLAGPDLSTTRAALSAAGWTVAGATAGRTLIAPTDAAWALLPPAQSAALLRPENRPSLVRLLRYWLVPVRVDTAGMRAGAATGAALPTVAGEPIAVGLVGTTPMLTDARGRRAYVRGVYAGATGAVVVINGIVAPMAIEPGGPQLNRHPGLVPGSTDGQAARSPG